MTRMTDQILGCPDLSIPGGPLLKTDRRACLSCTRALCVNKPALVEVFLTPIRDIAELAPERLTEQQKRMGFCPMRARVGKYCNANRSYCAYAYGCPQRQFPTNLKSLRYEVLPMKKGGVFGLVLNETDPIKIVRVADSSQLPAAQRVYRLTHRIQVVSDLVPVSDTDRKRDVETLLKSFSGLIVDTAGKKVKLSLEWLDKADIGMEVYVADQEFAVAKRVIAAPMNKYKDPADASTYDPKGNFTEVTFKRPQKPAALPPIPGRHAPQKPGMVPLKAAPKAPVAPKAVEKKEPKVKIAKPKVLGPRLKLRAAVDQLRAQHPQLDDKTLKKMAKLLMGGR